MSKFKLISMLKCKDDELLSHILKGNVKKVSKLILKGADVNKNDALHRACQNGHRDIAALLLDKGADPDKVNNAHETPLHIAARSDCSQINIMKILIEKGATVDSRNETHDTPLHYAVLEERIDDIKLLLSAGADANAQNSKGETALDCVKNTNIRNLLNKHIQEKKIKKKKNDFKPELDFKLNYSPLHITSEQGCMIKAENILKRGVDVNKKTDPFCFTALHLASANGHKDIVELLLENGADISAENKAGHTPLHIAVRSTHCHEDIVELLIDRGANINSKTKRHGNTSLHYAAQNGYKAVVRLLLDAGAVLDAKNNKGKTAFHYAKNQDIKNFLLSEPKKRNEVDYHSSSNRSNISDTSSTYNNDLCFKDKGGEGIASVETNAVNGKQPKTAASEYEDHSVVTTTASRGNKEDLLTRPPTVENKGNAVTASNTNSTCSPDDISDEEDYQDNFDPKQISCSILDIRNWIFEKWINLFTHLLINIAAVTSVECDNGVGLVKEGTWRYKGCFIRSNSS